MKNMTKELREGLLESLTPRQVEYDENLVTELRHLGIGHQKEVIHQNFRIGVALEAITTVESQVTDLTSDFQFQVRASQLQTATEQLMSVIAQVKQERLENWPSISKSVADVSRIMGDRTYDCSTIASIYRKLA